jgi:hypothetical protein
MSTEAAGLAAAAAAAASHTQHPSVLAQAFLSPLTTVLILIIVIVYTYNKPNILNVSPLHVKKYSYNYNEVIKEKEGLQKLEGLQSEETIPPPPH